MTVPPSNETALRDRIVDALLAPRYGGPQHNTPGGLRLTATPEEARRHRAGQIADIVLGVLPAPTDRSAVLREAADVAERLMDERYGPDCSYGVGGQDVARELRRLADEPDDTVHGCPGRWGGPDCRCFDDEPATGAQQGGAGS